jgi:hypothetical protein
MTKVLNAHLFLALAVDQEDEGEGLGRELHADEAGVVVVVVDEVGAHNQATKTSSRRRGSEGRGSGRGPSRRGGRRRGISGWRETVQKSPGKDRHHSERRVRH